MKKEGEGGGGGPRKKALPRYRQLCPSETAYRRLERRGELPSQLRSGGLATGHPSEAELDVLQAVAELRYCLVDHIQGWLGAEQLSAEEHRALVRHKANRPPSPQLIGQAVTRLFHHAFLGRMVRLRRLRVGLDVGSEKFAYCLDRRGIAALRGFRPEVAAKLSWEKSHTRRGEVFINHELEITDFRVTLELALRSRRDLELVHWRQDHELADRFRYRDAETHEVVRATVRPDAFFVIKERGKLLPHFLELDRGSMDHTKLAEKLQRLYRYLRLPNAAGERGSGAYLKRYAPYNPQEVRVLVVMKVSDKASRSVMRGETEPKTRYERIFAPKSEGGTLASVRANKKELFRLFWITRLEQYDLATPETILGPIWRRHGMAEGEGHPLFGPAPS